MGTTGIGSFVTSTFANNLDDSDMPGSLSSITFGSKWFKCKCTWSFYFQNPLPGTPINTYDNFEKNIESKESDFFCVVEIKLCKIDWLFLKREGHRRANIFLDDKKEDLWVSP